MPIALFATRTRPNSPSCTGPTITMTTKSPPRIALNLVATFASRIWPIVRVGCLPWSFTWPAATRSATSAADKPVADRPVAAGPWVICLSSCTACPHGMRGRPRSGQCQEEPLELFSAHRGLAVQALEHIARHYLEARPVKRPRDGGELGHHVAAVPALLDHRDHACQLALRPPEPVEHGGAGVALRIAHVLSFPAPLPAFSSLAATPALTSSMSTSRAWPIRSSRAASGSAPGCAYRITLSLITISVGIDVMPKACARSCCASVSTLPNTRSSCCSEARSKIGPNIRHGPHQDAQKSTSASGAPPTTSSKFCAVSSTVATADLRPRGIAPCERYPPGY